MDYLQKLDELIASKHMLKTPFYIAWTKGELTNECLKHYAKEYYYHVAAFPTYLSAVHAKCDDPETRLALLKNLNEEEGGTPNHPALWKEFAAMLNVNQLHNHVPGASVKQLVAIFRENCQDVAMGIASLYAYESQIPEICISKIDGLEKHYGISAPKYFTVHIEADREHAADERALLSRYVNSENFEAVYAAVNRVLDALWNLLASFRPCDAICH